MSTELPLRNIFNNACNDGVPISYRDRCRKMVTCGVLTTPRVTAILSLEATIGSRGGFRRGLFYCRSSLKITAAKLAAPICRARMDPSSARAFSWRNRPWNPASALSHSKTLNSATACPTQGRACLRSKSRAYGRNGQTLVQGVSAGLPVRSTNAWKNWRGSPIKKPCAPERPPHRPQHLTPRRHGGSGPRLKGCETAADASDGGEVSELLVTDAGRLLRRW
jgi:hypothetical protein